MCWPAPGWQMWLMVSDVRFAAPEGSANRHPGLISHSPCVPPPPHPSVSLPGVFPATGGSDGERHPDVGALSAAAAEPGRRLHAGRPAGEHLEAGEPLPEPQRLAAEAGDPHQGSTEHREPELPQSSGSDLGSVTGHFDDDTCLVSDSIHYFLI